MTSMRLKKKKKFSLETNQLFIRNIFFNIPRNERNISDEKNYARHRVFYVTQCVKQSSTRITTTNLSFAIDKNLARNHGIA